MFKALRTRFSTYAIALLISCGLTSPSWAGSGDFAGIYAAVYGSAAGAEIDGTHTGGTDGTNPDEVTKGQVGGVFPVGGYDIGFNLPLGDMFFVGVGHSWTMSGTVTIADGQDTKQGGGSNSEGDTQSNASFHLKAKDLKSVYVMPSLSIYDNSAIYLKYGRTIADTELTGGVHGTPNNLTGEHYGVGTIAMTNSGIFIKTEGSVTTFDDINIIGAASQASLVEGNPDVVAGTIAIGFKF